MSIITKKYGYKQLEDLFEALTATENRLCSYMDKGNDISWVHNISIADDHYVLDVTIYTNERDRK